MKLGVFANSGIPYLRKLAAGARKIGWEVDERLPDAKFRDMEGCDLVAVGGNLRRYDGANGRIFAHFRATGTPVLVVEMGRMLNPEIPHHNHWIFYLNEVPSRPPDCIGPEFVERRQRIFPPVDFLKKRGHAVVVMGQDRDIDALMEVTLLLKIREATNRPIIWRPRKEHSKPDLGPCDYSSRNRTLEQDIEQAWCVVAHSSNAAGEALRRGIPVICDPSASYRGIAWSHDVADIEKSKRPKVEGVENYFRAMAHITWSNEEMEAGAPLEWLVETGQIQERSKAPAIITKRATDFNITALTCTGGRQTTFNYLEDYLARQTLKPKNWVVVDDVEPRTSIANTEVVENLHRIYPDEPWKPGDMTYARNFRAACECIQTKLPETEWVAIFEDDDWYHPEYLEFFIPILDSRMADGVLMGGEFANVYYHVGVRRWTRVGLAARNATMAATIFHASLIPEILKTINGYGGLSLDLQIFRNIPKSKWILYDTDHVIGIKGVPQNERSGGTHSHTLQTVARAGWIPDVDLEALEGFVGDDVERYSGFFDASFAEARSTPGTPRRPMRQRSARLEKIAKQRELARERWLKLEQSRRRAP